MEPIKIVVRYADGRVLKGFTQNFLPNKPTFHVRPEKAAPGDATEVKVAELKAVFFVRDFVGDSRYIPKKAPEEGEKRPTRLIEVTCSDGETIVGSTTGYDSGRPGFFVFPVDPKDNNLRAFIVSKAVTKVRYL